MSCLNDRNASEFANDPIQVKVWRPHAFAALAIAKGFLISCGFTDHWLSAPETHLVTAECDAGLRGCGAATIVNASAVLMSFAVDREHRGRGIGTKMVLSMLHHLAVERVKVVFLFSRKSGAFWTRLGFSPAPVEQVAEAAAGHFQVKAFVADGSIWTDRAFRMDLSHPPSTLRL